jgi:signal transduction histidine kinase
VTTHAIVSVAPALAPPAAEPPATRRPLALLLVEDNPGDAELLQLLLVDDADAAGMARAAGARGANAQPLASAPQVTWVERVGAAREALARAEQAGAPFDVVLLDLTLPDARGLATVAAVHAAAPALPIVVLTGLDDEALAVQALAAGAQDYLVKGAVTGAGVRRSVRHAMERQRLLLEAQRATRARDVVLGVVAHDLRNPISTIKMCAAALGDHDDASPAPAEHVAHLAGVVQRSAEWMEHIIRDLLDVTAIEAGRLAVDPAPVSLGEVLDRARELHAPLAAEKGVAFDVAMDDGTVLLMADAGRVLQALGNLVGNALKFTPSGGRVTVRGDADQARPVVRLEVADTGPGIAPDHLPHVFDRFWQARETRRAGAGLGLAIVKGIVEAHDGAVTVESTVGEGTRFRLELPRA